ncbi:MAG: hypothetical protein R6U94_11440 [Nitriliruptoraceae bacterium]
MRLRAADPLPCGLVAVLSAAGYAMKKLALRHQDLDAEIKDLDRQLTWLVPVAAPELVARPGIGIHTTAILLVTAGDDPERLHSEAASARLTGTAPRPPPGWWTGRCSPDASS